jgi:hypothetical protein
MKAMALALGLTVVGAAGCAATLPAARPVTIDRGFPARAELAAVAKRPLLPREEALDKGWAVARWELGGPFPDRTDRSPTNDAEGRVTARGSTPEAFGASAARRIEEHHASAVMTPHMSCYAREMGRFVARHGQLPEDDLQAFAAGRCGVIPITPSLVFALPPEAPTDEALVEFIDALVPKLSPPTETPSEVGVWWGDDHGRHVMIAAFGAPKVKLTSVEPGARGSVRLRGTLFESTAWLRGYTSDGALGVHRCESTPRTNAVLPDFDLTCRVSPDDAYAVFDMLAAEPNAVLGRQALTLVLSTGRPVPSTFESLTLAGGEARDLLDQFNALRARLGRPALHDVPLQNQTASTLVPHYFTAAAQGDEATLDLITLGMMAGWDVPGPLRDAQFLSFRGARGAAGANLLSQLFFFPSNRAVVLDADAKRIAWASVEDDRKKAIWGLLTTYTTFEPRSYPDVERDLLDDLDRQRQARGRKPAHRVQMPEVARLLDAVMERLARGQLDPMQGLEKALRTLSRRLQRPFQGRVAYAMAIDNFHPVYDGALVDAEDVAATTKIGFYAAPGDHWGQYVSYVIFGASKDAERGLVTPKGDAPRR